MAKNALNKKLKNEALKNIQEELNSENAYKNKFSPSKERLEKKSIFAEITENDKLKHIRDSIEVRQNQIFQLTSLNLKYMRDNIYPQRINFPNKGVKKIDYVNRYNALTQFLVKI